MSDAHTLDDVDDLLGDAVLRLSRDEAGWLQLHIEGVAQVREFALAPPVAALIDGTRTEDDVYDLRVWAMFFERQAKQLRQAVRDMDER